MILRSTIIGLALLALPVTAGAQCPSTSGAAALAKAQPLGHYAQRVVKRVDEGLTKAKSASGGNEIVEIFNLHFLSTIQSIFFLLVDTDLRAVEYKRDLTTINSCLHYDLAILEAKIEEVRCETLEAYQRKSPNAIYLLKSLTAFLNQRYKHLVKGGLEPGHTDKSWPYYYSFDDDFEGWCCVLGDAECQVKTAEECRTDEGSGGNQFFTQKDACLTNGSCFFAEEGEATPKYADQCPFDSDYLASSTNGYGCDITVLEKIEEGVIPGVDAEIEALKNLAETRDKFLEDIDHIKDTTVSMDTLMNNNMLSDEQREALEKFGETKVEDIEHKRVYGCYADLTPEEREELEPPNAEEDNSGSEGELTEGVRPSQEWIRITLRNAFFFRKDHLEIWKTFLQLQREYSSQRQFPDYLKKANEFYDESDRKAAMERDASTFRLISIPRDYIRELWSTFQLGQATKDAGLLPKTQDIGLQVRDAMKPIRAAMKKNVELISDKTGGMRQFAINYAYYLRRSCIFRPCNEKLERIMQILLSDECFPYAKGEIGSWEDCKEAVENLADE